LKDLSYWSGTILGKIHQQQVLQDLLLWQTQRQEPYFKMELQNDGGYQLLALHLTLPNSEDKTNFLAGPSTTLSAVHIKTAQGTTVNILKDVF